MKHDQQLPRRTFSQDRFDILIKRQKSGKATFKELTELDEIVNRDPSIREIVLEEMQDGGIPPDDVLPKQLIDVTPNPPKTLIDKLWSIISRLFTGDEQELKPVLN